MSITVAPTRQAAAARLAPSGARLAVLLAMAAGAAAGIVLSRHGVVTDAALVRLVRAMAVIKMGIAAATGAALYWRLAEPVGTWRLWAYAAAVGAMAAGPGLIWNMAHIPAGAALLHGGLAATILLLWRDPGMARRLEREIAERKRSLF